MKSLCHSTIWQALFYGLVVASMAATLPGGRAAAESLLPIRPWYVVHPVEVDKRVSSAAIVTMAQDSSGFIWVGTQSGLLRFDGREVVELRQEQGLPSAYIEQVIEGPDKRIWVATREGIALLDGQRAVARGGATNAVSAGPKDVVLQQMAFDAEGRLFVASATGLTLIDSPGTPAERSRVLQVEHGQVAPLSAVVADRSGDIWFAQGSRLGLVRAGSQRAELLPQSAFIADGRVLSILPGAGGELWVRTVSSLWHRVSAEASFVRDSVELPDGVAEWGLPIMDRGGDVLMPTVRGLYWHRASGWQRVTEENGLPSGSIYALLEDREGALWVSVAGAGLVRMPEHRAWSAWRREQGLSDNTVWGILRDRRNRLWVGTSDGVSIWLPEDEKWLVLRKADGLAGNEISQLAQTTDGTIWAVSARVGLTRFDPESLAPRAVPLPPGYLRYPVSIAADSRGRLWIGGYHSLHTLDAAAAESVFVPQSLPPEINGCTRTLGITAGDVLWSAGLSGLCRFDGTRWQRFTTADGLRIDYVDQIAAISPSELWISYRDYVRASHVTLSGEHLQVRHLTQTDGLASDAVFMIGVDRAGNAWIGGDSGVTRVGTDGTARVLNRVRGLVWDDVDGYGFWPDADGSVFIGTSGGLAHVDPPELLAYPPSPHVVITSAQLGGRDVLGQSQVVVPYTQRDLYVRFSGLTFEDPGAVSYEYRLRGLDNAWHETLNRELRFPALPWGHYDFEIRCRVGAGQWSVQPAFFSFAVAPPWWGRWWVRGLGALCLVLLGLAIGKLRSRKLEQDRYRLEKAVAERSAQLAQANRELEELSFTDALTGLRNRRYFSNVIFEEIARVHRRYFSRQQEPAFSDAGMVFCLVDIDFFKKVNDTFGHRAGDELLVQVAQRLRDTARKTDLVMRWGGEEFLVVSRDTAPDEGYRLAQRILQVIGDQPFLLPDGMGIHRTCSVGWAPYPWTDEDPAKVSYELIVELADKGLYFAKNGGRHRAVGVLPMVSGATSEIDPSWGDMSLEDLRQRQQVRLVVVEGQGRSVHPTPAPRSPTSVIP